MKVARTKAQLKHLKTKRKKAKDKRQRRQARERTTGMMMAMRVDDASEGAVGMVATDVDEEPRETGTGTGTGTGGRARQSDVARRKRELRDRIAELKSKRSKIGKKNFGKSEERKRLTMMIKALEKGRAAACAGGGGGAGAEDTGDKDDAMVDAH